MTNEEMDFIRQSIASHDRQLGELVDRMAETDRKLDRVVEIQEENARQIAANSNEIRTAIDIMVATVGKVALLIENHERRIQGLEGTPTA